MSRKPGWTRCPTWTGISPITSSASPAILQGIKKRVIDGTASSAQAAQMAQRVIPLAQAAWEYAKKAGAQ